MKKNSKKNRKGFTLVELIATIAILGVISAIAVLTFNGVSKNTREKTYNALLASIRVQAKNFYEDTGVEKFYVQTLLDYGYLTPDDNTGDIKSPKDNSKINCYTITKNDNNFDIDETPKDECETEDGIVSTGLIQAQFNCEGEQSVFSTSNQAEWHKVRKMCFSIALPAGFDASDIEKRYWGYRGDSTYVNYNDTFEVDFDGNEFSDKVFNDYLYAAFELKDQIKKLNILDFQFKNDLVLPSFKPENKENCSSKKNIAIRYKDEGSGIKSINLSGNGLNYSETFTEGIFEKEIEYKVDPSKTYTLTMTDFAGNVLTEEITFTNAPRCEFTVNFKEDYALVKSQKVEYGEKATFYEYSRNYQIADFWSLTSDLNKVYDFDTPVTNDLTLYAKMIYKTFKANLDRDGGSSGSDYIYEQYNTHYYLDADRKRTMTTGINPINLPTKVGYDFKGYYTGTNGIGTQYINENGYITTSASKTYFKNDTGKLYAKWTPSTYTISLNNNGATSTGSASTTVKYLDTKLSSITKPLKTVTITYINNTGATKRGGDNLKNYTLNGWYTSTASSGLKVADNNSIPNLQANSGYTDSNGKWTETSSRTLYAKWNSVTANLPTIEKAGHICKWTTAYNGTTDIASGGQWTFSSANSRTFTAVCTPKTIRVYYNGNGGNIGGIFKAYGSWVSEDGNSKYIHSVSNGGSLDLWNPSGGAQWMLITKTGYYVPSSSEWKTYNKNCTFAQDYTSSNHATPYINFFNCSEKYEPSGQNYLELSLYVNWVPNTFTVAYNANGGSGSVSSHTCTYDSACSLKSNGFTRSGYTFAGWKKYNSGSTLAAGTSIKNTVTSGTVTYYAQWTAKTFTVAYNANGGSGSVSSHTCTYGSTCSLKSNGFTRSGYTFSGWKKNNAGTTLAVGTNVGTAATSGTVTYYAQWTACTLQYRCTTNGDYQSRCSDGSTSWTNTGIQCCLTNCQKDLKNDVCTPAGHENDYLNGNHGTFTCQYKYGSIVSDVFRRCGLVYTNRPEGYSTNSCNISGGGGKPWVIVAR